MFESNYLESQLNWYQVKVMVPEEVEWHLMGYEYKSTSLSRCFSQITPQPSEVLDSNQGETKDIKNNMKGNIGVSLYPNLNKLLLFFLIMRQSKKLKQTGC